MSSLTTEHSLPRYCCTAAQSISASIIYTNINLIVFYQESSLRKQPSFRWANYDSPVKSPTRPAPDPPQESPRTSPHRPEHDMSISIVCACHVREDAPTLISESMSPAPSNKSSKDCSINYRGIGPPGSRSFRIQCLIKWPGIFFANPEPRRIVLEL